MGSSNLSSAPMLLREAGFTPWACYQVAPPFPKHNPSLRQSFLRKVRCVPSWWCVSPSCAQGVPAHTQMSSFAQLITSSLCSSSVPSPNLPKERTHSVDDMGDLTCGNLSENIGLDLRTWPPHEVNENPRVVERNIVMPSLLHY
jgi:hypothetical protein